MAFFQPLVGLGVDAVLSERFLNVIMGGIERRRILAAGFGSRQNGVLVKILNGLLVHLNRGPETRVEIVVQIELIGGESADFGFGEVGEFAASVVIGAIGKAFFEAVDSGVNIALGRL